MKAKEFLLMTGNTTTPEQDMKETGRVLKVIHDFMSGIPLDLCLEKQELSYNKFRIILLKNPNIQVLFGNATGHFKENLKNRLLGMAYMSAKTDTGMLKFLLERMYPDDFGKKSDININLKQDLVPEDVTKYFNYVEEKPIDADIDEEEDE
jgi:hypothetical protein